MLVGAVTAYGAFTRPAPARLSDLAVYIGAVDGLRHGASLYDFVGASAAPFTYPPFAGLLFLPLTVPPAVTVQIGWTVATLTTVAWLAYAAARKPMSAPVLALVLMLSAPVSSNLRYGQVSVLLAALVTADVLRPSRAQGLLIGIAAAVKLTPLIFIPMLWYAGRRAAAVTAAATFTGCALLAAIVLPADSWRFWAGQMWNVSRLGAIASVGNQSLNGALLRLGIAAPARDAIVVIAGGTVAAIALRRAARLGRCGDWPAALVVTGAAGVVLSPVSWTHHQIWLVLAALLPVRSQVPLRRAWQAAVLTVMLLPVTALGPPVWSNARLVLAVAVAVAVPLVPENPYQYPHRIARIGSWCRRPASAPDGPTCPHTYGQRSSRSWVPG